MYFGEQCVWVWVSVHVQTTHVQSLCSTLASAEWGDIARVFAELGCAVAGYLCARLATKITDAANGRAHVVRAKEQDLGCTGETGAAGLTG